MSLLRLASLASVVLLSSVLTWSQTHGGGGGHPGPPPPVRTGGNSGRTAPSPSGSGFPGSTPFHTADEEGKIEFRTQAILVQVPVVITDKSGNHIHGLTKDDFHIFENGKEQKLSTFEEIVATNAKLPVVAAKPGEFTNLTLSEQQPRSVTVIALDTVNTPFLDQTYGRRELVKYLANSLESGQVFALMIITSHGLKVVQGLTGDSAHLMDILKKTGGEVSALQTVGTDAQADAATGDIPGPPILISQGADPAAAMADFVERGDAIYAQFQQQNAIETTMNAFRGIAWALSGIPGRKSLIWATGGFPFVIGSPSTVPGGYLSTLYERAMEALSDANISVYPVDVRGLVNTSPISDMSARVRTGADLARQINNRSWLQQSSIDTLNEFAEMTGGKAFYNTNDLASSFKRAADDASSYYLAGYYLDTHNNNAGWRQLKVKVDKKNTEVRARKGFFVTNATIHLEMTRDSDMSYALTSPIEGTGVPISVKWAGVTGDGEKKKAIFMAQMPVNGLAFDSGEQNKLNFDFAAMAFNNKDGKVAGQVAVNFAKPISEAQVAAVRATGVGFRNALELGPGSYTVRFVVRDNVTGKVGSVTAPLTVN